MAGSHPGSLNTAQRFVAWYTDTHSDDPLAGVGKPRVKLFLKWTLPSPLTGAFHLTFDPGEFYDNVTVP